MQHAPAHGSLKTQNQKTILNMLRKNRFSRMELASTLGLTRSSITLLVDQLIANNLVQETETVTTSRGRHPVLLDLVGNARYTIGVNIMRQSIDVGILNLTGQTLARDSLASARLTPQAACRAIAKTVRAQIKALELDHRLITGVGVCAPGPLDYRQGRLLNPPNFPAWHGFAAADELQRLLEMPVCLENVSNALAIEEKYYGVAQNLSDFLVLQINEGIGAGIFVHDVLYRGAHGLGAEVGHASISYKGRPCPCGNRGCLEMYASIPSILKDTAYKSWTQLVDAAASQPQALALIEKEADYIATAVVNVLNLFDVDKVVLLGDVVYRPRIFLDSLNAELEQRRPNLSGVCSHLLQCGVSRIDFRAGAMVCLSRFFEDPAFPLFGE